MDRALNSALRQTSLFTSSGARPGRPINRWRTTRSAVGSSQAWYVCTVGPDDAVRIWHRQVPIGLPPQTLRHRPACLT